LAKGCTAAEFKEVLTEIKEELKLIESEREDVHDMLKLTGGWKFSWDNDGCHTSASEDHPDLERFPLTPHSPDMHCVVEHAVGRTWRRFKRRRQLELGPDPPMDEYMDLLVEFFEEACDSHVIWGDCARLPLIYKVISSPTTEWVDGYQGSAGNWPHPRLYH